VDDILPELVLFTKVPLSGELTPQLVNNGPLFLHEVLFLGHLFEQLALLLFQFLFLHGQLLKLAVLLGNLALADLCLPPLGLLL
jgi:hypothetical protein